MEETLAIVVCLGALSMAVLSLDLPLTTFKVMHDPVSG